MTQPCVSRIGSIFSLFWLNEGHLEHVGVLGFLEEVCALLEVELEELFEALAHVGEVAHDSLDQFSLVTTAVRSC